MIPPEIEDAIAIFHEAKTRMEAHTIDDGFSDMEHPVCGCEILSNAQDHLIDKLLSGR